MFRKAAVLIAVAALVGCESSNDTLDSDYPDSVKVSQKDAKDMKSGELAKFDREFIEDAAASGLFEVRSSELAQQRLQGDMRSFADQMISDHKKANEQLLSLARSKGMQIKPELGKKYEKLYNDLQSAQGDGFAARYQDIQRDAHNQAIALFERAMNEARDFDVRKFASDTLPTLRHHREMLTQYSPPGAATDPNKDERSEVQKLNNKIDNQTHSNSHDPVK